VRVFGFFVNFVLIATFLGMGVGLLAERLGGVLEYAAMAIGIKALYLIAAAACVATLVAVVLCERLPARPATDAVALNQPS
jgi:hypothetical protein